MGQKLKKPEPIVPKERPYKSTNAEVELRVAHVQALMLEGYTQNHIVRECSPVWQVSKRQIQDYMADARVNILEMNKTTLQENAAIISAQLWETFRRARRAGETGEERATLQAIAKLKGLEKTNIILDDKRELEDLPDEELDLILEGK